MLRNAMHFARTLFHAPYEAQGAAPMEEGAALTAPSPAEATEPEQPEDLGPPMSEDAIGQPLVKALEDPEHARYYNIEVIDRAFRLARAAHKGQIRRSGEPYLIHPVEVAVILVD
ncbi:MAG: hypothetical protein IJC43_03560, partial [Clostridia bacterium]|nr:hypothetical protein [Clostridia bacterium]